MTKDYILTEETFLNLIDEINSQLKEDGLDLFWRPGAACDKIAAKYNLSRRFPAPSTKPKTNSFKDNVYLMKRVFDWYKQRYGDKLKTDFLGSIAILIKGEVYKMNFAYGFGMFYPECSVENFNKDIDFVGSIDIPPTLNILKLIEGITESLVKSLSQSELKEILDIFNIGHNAKYRMNALLDIELVKQARGDLDASTAHFFSNPPQYGLSKWASLQAAEKLLKAFIQTKKEEFKLIHDLSKLSKKAAKLGLNKIPKSLIDSIQCLAGVRYGETKVTLDEAIQAHHAALDICWGVANHIVVARRSKENIWLTPGKYYVDGGAKIWRCVDVDDYTAKMLYFNDFKDGKLEYFTQRFGRKNWAEFFDFDSRSVIDQLEELYQQLLIKEKNQIENAKKIIPFKV